MLVDLESHRCEFLFANSNSLFYWLEFGQTKFEQPSFRKVIIDN